MLILNCFVSKRSSKRKRNGRPIHKVFPLFLKQSPIAEWMMMGWKLVVVDVHRPPHQNSRRGDVQCHECPSAFHWGNFNSAIGKFRFHERFRQPGSNTKLLHLDLSFSRLWITTSTDLCQGQDGTSYIKFGSRWYDRKFASLPEQSKLPSPVYSKLSTLFKLACAHSDSNAIWLLLKKSWLTFNAQHDAVLDYYGRRLATCSSDRTVKIFEVEGETHRLTETLKG